MSILKKMTNVVLISIVSFCMLLGCRSTEPSTASKWLLIDDFEQPALQGWVKADTKNNTRPFTENPQVTEIKKELGADGQAIGNHYLIKKPAKDGLVGNRKALTYKALPTSVNVGETYTFFTRLSVEYFPNNHAFGISNQTPQDIEKLGYDAFEPTLRVTDKTESSGLKNDGALMVKVDGGYENVQNYAEQRSSKPLVAGQWYDIWYVVNNSTVANGGQSYDVYVKGGEFLEQTLVYKNAQFRKKRELPLIYFFMNCNTGPHKKPYGNGGLQYDDIYMAKGVELSSPLLQ